MPDDPNNNEHNSTDRTQQYITAITPMIRGLFRRSDAESAAARTYATPTVRFTTEELRKQIDRSIDEADVRIAALRDEIERHRNAISAAKAVGANLTMRDYAPAGDNPEMSLAALEARRRYLAFTREHLTPDSVFVMSASEAYGLLTTHQHTHPSIYPAHPAGLPL